MSLMMSVSGIRGIVGETMTPQLAVDVGSVFGSYVVAGRVVLARDSRPSGPMIHAAVMSGLLSAGCEVIDLGVVTTPGAAMMVGELGADGGVIVTASHNPVEWNGIKFITREGTAPPKREAEEIIARCRARESTAVPVRQVRSARTDATTHERHVAKVLATVDVEAIRRRRFRVVLDSVCGAGGAAGRRLLSALGCEVTHLNGEPTGWFPHPPEPLAAHLEELCEAVTRSRAHVGFAQDPDADRLAIVDETGAYIGEELTLALAARQILSERPGTVVANLSTSRMVDVIAQGAGGTCAVHRSAVGEANVVEVMKRTEAVLGGEGNGGVIDPRVVHVRDSLVAMGRTLQLLADEDVPLSQIVSALPAYHMVKQKFACEPQQVGEMLAALKARFGHERIDETDGVRIDWPEGWAHVRGSNTEPVARIIAEAESEATAHTLIDRVRGAGDVLTSDPPGHP